MAAVIEPDKKKHSGDFIQFPAASLRPLQVRSTKQNKTSWKVSYHRRLEELYVAQFLNQSEFIIHALIQSEMELHTTIPIVGDNSLFKKMCTGLNVPTSAPGCVAPGMVFGSHRIDIWAACPGRDVSEIIFDSRHNNDGHSGDWS